MANRLRAVGIKNIGRGVSVNDNERTDRDELVELLYEVYGWLSPALERDADMILASEWLRAHDVGVAAAATRKVTRFEVIDESGRALVRYGVSVSLSVQDDGRTLKAFLRARGVSADPETEIYGPNGSIVTTRDRMFGLYADALDWPVIPVEHLQGDQQ